jgi:uncharacterized FlaG/YvyC family protein
MDKQMVYLYDFGTNENNIKALGNIVNFLAKLLKEEIPEVEFEISTTDLKVFECAIEPVCISFGQKVEPYVKNPKLQMITLPISSILKEEKEENKKNKKIIKKDIESFVSQLKTLYNSNKIIDNPSSSAYVEVKEGVTAGINNSIFNFTLEEVEHLKKIKELLGGGKIIFTKGDTRLEIH